MKCKKCGQSKSWTERITKGITQIISYDDGYIVREITDYDKGQGTATCNGCGAEYQEYDL